MSVNHSQAIDLAHDLATSTSGEVRFDDGSRALYATDGSNHRQAPIGVAITRTTDDIIAIVKLARQCDVDLTWVRRSSH